VSDIAQRDGGETTERTRYVVALVTITAIGAVLRFARLSAQGLWLDEAYLVQTRDLIGSEGFDVVATRDNVSPLWHWILYGWEGVAGAGRFAFRFPSAVAGTLTIVVLAELGRRLYDRRVGLVAAALLAVSPYAIWYSQDARMYAPLLLLSVTGLLVFHLADAQPGRASRWVALTVVTAAGLYTHQYFLLTCAVCGAYLVASGRWRGEVGRRWALSMAVGAATYVPWFLISSGSDVGLAGSEKAGALLWFPYAMFTFVGGFSLGPSVRESQTVGALEAFRPDLWWLAPIGICLALLLVVGLRNLRRQGSSRSNLFAASAFVVPMVLAIAAPVASTRINFNVRYVIMTLPIVLLVLAATTLDPRPRRWVGLSAAVFLTATAASLAGWYGDDRYAKEDLTVIGPYLADHVAAGDRVLISSDTVAESAATFGFGGEVTEVSPATLDDVVEEVRDDPPLPGEAVWLVESRTWESDPDGELRAALDSSADLESVAKWPGVEIRRYSGP
jgi:uncharacterized membrane protein